MKPCPFCGCTDVTLGYEGQPALRVCGGSLPWQRIADAWGSRHEAESCE